MFHLLQDGQSKKIFTCGHQTEQANLAVIFSQLQNPSGVILDEKLTSRTHTKMKIEKVYDDLR